MVTVRLLGIPAVLDEAGRELPLRSRKQLGVLLYLVLDGRERPVARDTLMDALWMKVPRERAYHSLCQAVTALRKLLGRDAVISRGVGLQLALPLRTDIEDLSGDQERSDLAHPLRDLEWWGGIEFGHWVEAARARCRAMAAEVLRQGIVAHREAGATLRVHRCAALLYELDPLSEPAALALAEQKLLQGDVVGAIRFLRMHRQRVVDALGCQPQTAVERLLRRLEAGAHPPVELVPKRLAAHAGRVRPTVLVARERELSHLEGEWQRVHRDRAMRSCVITGGGGIGKSSLIRRFAATVASRAQPAFLVSCQEMGEGIPFAAVADLVTALLRDPSVSGTDPLWLAEVSRIQPAIRTQYSGVPAPLDSPPEAVRVRIAEGVTRMIAAVTDGAPLVLLFDDLQYMDPATRDVLAVLVRRAHQLPLFLIGTTRSLGIEAGLPSGPLGQHAMPWTTSLRLGPLTDEGTRSLLGVLAPELQLDTPLVARRIVELSEGNPQFAEMLLADWHQYASASLAAGRAASELPADWRPPESLRHAFAKLYEGLGGTTRQLLQMLAVAQRALTPEELTQILGQSSFAMDQGALELLTAGILRLDQGALTFKNELHRAFAYSVMNPESQKYHHGILARAISRLASSDSDFRIQLEVGHHYLKSGNISAARELIASGARLAIKAGAPGEAEDGLNELVRSDTSSEVAALQVLLASAQLAGNKPRDSLATLSLIRTPSQDSRDDLELRLLRLRAVFTLRAEPADSFASELEEVLLQSTSLGLHDIALPAVQLAAELATERGRIDQLESLRGHCQSILKIGVTGDELAAARLSLGFMNLVLGQFEEAGDLFKSGVTDLEAGRGGPLYWRLLNGWSVAAMAIGRFAEAQATLEELEKSVASTTLLPSPVLWSNIAVFWQERGRLRRACEYFRRAITALPSHPDVKARATVLSLAASFAMDLGHFEVAEQCIECAQAGVADSRISTDDLDSWLVKADWHLAMSEDELAWRILGEHVLQNPVYRSAIGESSRHERLLRHHVFVSEGPTAYEDFCSLRSSVLARLPLHGRIELQCLDEWIRQQDRRSLERAVVRRVVSDGWAGTVLHLAAIGVFAAVELSARPTPRQVLELYPGLFPEGMPEQLDWDLPVS